MSDFTSEEKQKTNLEDEYDEEHNDEKDDNDEILSDVSSIEITISSCSENDSDVETE